METPVVILYSGLRITQQDRRNTIHMGGFQLVMGVAQYFARWMVMEHPIGKSHRSKWNEMDDDWGYSEMS